MSENLTIIDRVINLYPELLSEKESIVKNECPSDFGFKDLKHCGKKKSQCNRCWNQEPKD